MSESAADPRPLAVPTKQLENDRFIVTEWRFAPGANTGWHRHAWDYVVVPMTGHTVNIEEPGLFNQLVSEFLTSVENGRYGTWKGAAR